MDRINNPVEMAIKMLEATQDSIFNSIVGPERAKPEPMIMGQPLNPILEQVVQNARAQGLIRQQMMGGDVSAPPVPTDTPAPMPAPAPPTEPEVPMPGDQPQSGMNDIMGMLGGGMNNGI